MGLCKSPSPISGPFRCFLTRELSAEISIFRWESLRATEGWAVLQHHAVLHTTLTVRPPKQVRSEPHLRVQLIQGSYFTILPTTEDANLFPRWYAGNIYAMERGLPRVVPFPSAPSKISPTTYDIFVSGDYEVLLSIISPCVLIPFRSGSLAIPIAKEGTYQCKASL